MEPGDSFFALSNFVRGKIDRYNLQYSDPLISRVEINPKNLAQSYVYLEFENQEKLLKTLNVGDDDIWFAQVVDSPYNDFEFIDTYAANEDFMEGYGVWHILDEDNIELLQNISKFLYPQEFDLDDQEFKRELGRKLIKYYPDEIDNILRDYVHERNNEMTQDARESIHKDINDYLKEFSFELVSYDTIKVKVGDLISLFYQYNVPHLPIKGLIKEIFQNQDSNLGGWDENRWEYGNDEYFDQSSVNREVYRNFTKIYEQLIEGYDDDSDLKKFFQLIERITAKFKVGKWNSLPKDPKFSFKIDEFDKDELKISLTLRKPDGRTKRISVTEPNFNNLLYQPELFDLAEI